jgi:hypothetical protein
LERVKLRSGDHDARAATCRKPRCSGRFSSHRARYSAMDSNARCGASSRTGSYTRQKPPRCGLRSSAAAVAGTARGIRRADLPTPSPPVRPRPCPPEYRASVSGSRIFPLTFPEQGGLSSGVRHARSLPIHGPAVDRTHRPGHGSVAPSFPTVGVHGLTSEKTPRDPWPAHSRSTSTSTFTSSPFQLDEGAGQRRDSL